MSAAAVVGVVTSTTSPTFGDVWWISLIKVVAVFALLVLLTLFTIWAERRVVGRMQHRIGPNRVGPQGLLQSLMDGIKLALKEQILPKAADKAVYLLAPLLSTGAAFLAFGVVPLGPEVSLFGHHTPLQVTDFPVAVLYVIAAASIGIYGIVLAGWSSGSTYPLLGALRSTAQMISYEVAMGLSFVGVFLFAGTMATSGIVAGQQHLWYGLTLLPSFAIYCVSMVGETNRAPFDLPEAEGELVGGFHTEYSSLTFALFFLAEYVNMVTVSALATTLFLGGWRAPWPLSLWSEANSGWWPLLWFLGKVLAFIFVFIWLRGTLPRLRYDQFMKLGWKFLIPVSLLWILAVATLREANNQGATRFQRGLVGVGLVVVFGFVSILWSLSTERRLREQEQAEEQRRADRIAHPRFRDYPTPPLPGEEQGHPVTVAVGAGSSEPSAELANPDEERS